MCQFEGDSNVLVRVDRHIRMNSVRVYRSALKANCSIIAYLPIIT